MRKQFISFALLLFSLTAGAQKIILHMPDNQKVEYEISQLDSITFDEGVYLTCPDDHHPHAIDLGLPSGTKWCCCNVGASTPEGYGGYYAWGETSEKSVYTCRTYAYFNDNTGWVDIGSDIAGTQYDVAHVRMGASWCMPSHEQQMELIDNCSRQWTQQNGVYGILVTGPSSGHIFLPAAGKRWEDLLEGVGFWGYYWSGSSANNYGLSYFLFFGSGNDDGYWSSWLGRDYGFSVRPVRVQN